MDPHFAANALMQQQRSTLDIFVQGRNLLYESIRLMGLAAVKEELRLLDCMMARTADPAAHTPLLTAPASAPAPTAAAAASKAAAAAAPTAGAGAGAGAGAATASPTPAEGEKAKRARKALPESDRCQAEVGKPPNRHRCTLRHKHTTAAGVHLCGIHFTGSAVGGADAGGSGSGSTSSEGGSDASSEVDSDMHDAASAGDAASVA